MQFRITFTYRLLQVDIKVLGKHLLCLALSFHLEKIACRGWYFEPILSSYINEAAANDLTHNSASCFIKEFYLISNFKFHDTKLNLI